MTVQLNPSLSAGTVAGTARAGQGAARESVRALGSALRQDDLAGAQQAWAQVVKNVPALVARRPEGVLAQMGKALADGDVAGAKAVLQDATVALRAQLGARPGESGPSVPGDDCGMPVAAEPAPQPAPAPTPSSTGGAAGTTLDVVA